MAKTPKAGWHPDPANPGRERYWDGTAWGDGRDAPPAKGKRRGGGFLKTVLALVLAGCVLIGGCVLLLAGGLNSKEEDGITRGEFNSIKQGDTRSEVIDRHGEPEDSQEFESQIPELQGKPSRSSCIYYPEKGKLTSKNAY
jgi:hypothetical protein